MYAGSGISKTIATTTVNAQLTAMRETAAPLPGLGASSSRSQAIRSAQRDVVSVATMLHPNRNGRADPRQVRRRIVQPYPHGKALGDDHPVDRAGDDRQAGPAAVLGLHACA